MKSANSQIRCKGQVYSVGNYLMTGKVLGKGHFARVEEATHRIIGNKVAIKIIDLTFIKEEYARRNLHREPRVMAKLRHPCIAALYETLMHGPRLYVVMEAAGGGDLCTHVLTARGTARGLPETRARALAAQLVSAVKHMHSRGVVHRDLKMENIMLDNTKQFIKIVDFGLSNVWCSGGALRTPCGSLEYAAPELFVDGRRYGPEVDLWSIGVIVYGMVTGGLPFTSAHKGEGKSRPQLRAAITRGFTRKQRAALGCVSNECKTFIQCLLEPNVECRMKIEEASRHKWIKRPGMRMKAHPLATPDPKANNEIYKHISELCGQSLVEVVAQIKADPFGAIAGMYNIKVHLHQLQVINGTDLLWSSVVQELRPLSPPEYKAKYEVERPDTAPSLSTYTPPVQQLRNPFNAIHKFQSPKQLINGLKTPQIQSGPKIVHSLPFRGVTLSAQFSKENGTILSSRLLNGTAKMTGKKQETVSNGNKLSTPNSEQRSIPTGRLNQSLSPRLSIRRSLSSKKPTYKLYDNGDAGLNSRLTRISEHYSVEQVNHKKNLGASMIETDRTYVRKLGLEENRLNGGGRNGDVKSLEFYRRAGDAGVQSWRTNGTLATPPACVLAQKNPTTTIKRASLGNIMSSPHPSSNSHCKSERAMPVGWYSSRSKESAPLPRFRRTTPLN